MLRKSPIERYELIKVSVLGGMLNQPDIQRVTIPNRVDSIFQSIQSTLKQGHEILAPGVLILCELNKTFYLIDGQHRFQAFSRLLAEEKYDSLLMANIIEVQSSDDMKALFNRINDTVPVARIPDAQSGKESTLVVKHFLDRYPLIFKSSRSGNVLRPHIHPTAFQIAVQKLLGIIPKPDELIHSLEAVNSTLKQMHILQFKIRSADRQSTLETIRNKATQKGGLYFGMFPTFECFRELLDKNSGEEKQEEL